MHLPEGLAQLELGVASANVSDGFAEHLHVLEGLELLKEAIVDALGGRAAGGGQLVITRARHHAALVRASTSLFEGAGALQRGEPAELVAVDVAEATDALGEMIGMTTIEDVLDRLFGSFCIGK